MNIKDALLQLDPSNANHWTQDGMPRLETVRILLGDPTITREQVTSAAPLFTRTNLVVGEQDADGVAPDSPGLPDVNQAEVTPAPETTVTLEEQHTELEHTIRDLQLEIAERTSYLTSLKNRLDQLASEIERTKPKETLATTISGYHEGVKRQLQARAEARRALLESGVSLKELAKITSGAPVDARRPKRP